LVQNSEYIQIHNHREMEEEYFEVEDEEDDFFEANDKDLIDKNLQEKELYGDDDDDDGSE
jgi:hypothetical protein